MARDYKLALPVLIAVFVGTWIGHSLDFRADDNQNPTSQQRASSSIANTDNNALIARLQQQIQALHSENRLLVQQLQTQSTKPGEQQSSAKPAPNQQLQDQLHALETEKQLRKAEDFSKWIMESQNASAAFNLNKELLHRFEQEPRNPEWAEQQENYYRQLFSDKEALRGFAFRDTQCRSTQCEVTVSISSTEQAQQLLQSMNSTLQDATILVATDEQRGTCKLYIGSHEKGFEFK